MKRMKRNEEKMGQYDEERGIRETIV